VFASFSSSAPIGSPGPAPTTSVPAGMPRPGLFRRLRTRLRPGQPRADQSRPDQSVPRPERVRRDRTRLRSVGLPLLIASPLALVVLMPSAAGGSTVELAVGGALAGTVACCYAIRLMYVAARRHWVAHSATHAATHVPAHVPAHGSPRATGHGGGFRAGGHPSGEGPQDAYRGTYTSVGLFGVGLLATGVVGIVVSVYSWRGEAPAASASWGFAGLLVAGAGFVPGMVLIPGLSHSPVTRLRRCLDGLSVGICLLFTVWLLVIAPNGSTDGLGFWVMLVAWCTLSVSTIAGVRAAKEFRGAAAAACGAALCVVGLSGLTLELAGDTDGLLPVLFLAMMAVAPVVSWVGVTDVTGIVDGIGRVARPMPGYPVLAVPAAAAIAVALFRLLTGLEFDRPSVVLGISGIIAIALRETLTAVDVSRYARRMTEQEAQFRSLVAGSTDVIMVLDADLVVRWQSPAAARQFGLVDAQVVGRRFLCLVHPDDTAAVADRFAQVLTPTVTAGSARPDEARDLERPSLFEAKLRDGYGVWRDTESSLTDQRRVPEVGGLVLHIRDIGERKEMKRMLHRLAFADQLTGLANRRQLLLSVAALRGSSLASGVLLLIELDGFTSINDVHGYDVGDRVLVEVARRLRAAVGDTDLAARLGGDEFAVLTESTSVRAYALAMGLVARLSEPISVDGVTARLTASIGLANVPRGENGEDVSRRADLALRRAKQLGRGRVEWYDQAIEDDAVRRMTLEQELPDAMLRGELDVIYQPVIDLTQDVPWGVEALLRWRHPRLGTLLPADVIPAAEHLGLINEIGGWVLHHSCRRLAAWLREGRDIIMTVNVSAIQLGSEDTCHDVAAALDLYGIPAQRLVLEVAEGGILGVRGRAEAVAEGLHQLRRLGVRTALDDFGTGPESLTHLRRLPLDLVKLGRSFFDETADRSGREVPIIEVMVGLGRRFGIDLVAQGLETPEHLDAVRRAGCRLGQGHLFARAQPAERIEAYLDSFRAGSG
jgi:diguanylate cyclase (GGDEF)-like protein/PAS domain S-box-containing protein